MNHPRRLISSNPSPSLERLLNSALLDEPDARGKARTKARALAALRERELAHTTQLTALALGESVTKMLGAVTLANSPVTTFRVALRGAFVGAAAGIAALAVLSVLRNGTPSTNDPAVLAAEAIEEPKPLSPREQPLTSQTEPQALATVDQLLRAGNAVVALERLDRIEATLRDVVQRDRAMLLRLRILWALERYSEVRDVAERALVAHPSEAQSAELRRFLSDAQSKIAQ